MGKKAEKQVPVRPARVTLRRRKVPPFFSTMPEVIHNPRPVPDSPLVVKKGSRTLPRMAAGIPGPLSATVTRNPRCPVRQFLEAEAHSLILPV